MGQAFLYGNRGSGSTNGTGGNLTVHAPAGATVTVSMDGNTRSRSADADGTAVFTGLSAGTWTVTVSNGSQVSTGTVTIVTDYAVTMAFFSATISVTYPAGSTVTCSDGTTTLTATTTTGRDTFDIPNAGTWTIKAVSGSSTASESVSITTSGQAESVTLSYSLYLYDNGAVSGYTWTADDDQDEATMTDKGTYLQLTAGADAYAMFRSKNKINVSGYKTLKITLTNASMKVDSGNSIWWGLSSTTEVDGDGMSTKSQYSSFSGSKELSVDISGVTTSMYVALCIGTPSSTGKFSARATQIWLE